MHGYEQGDKICPGRVKLFLLWSRNRYVIKSTKCTSNEVKFGKHNTDRGLGRIRREYDNVVIVLGADRKSRSSICYSNKTNKGPSISLVYHVVYAMQLRRPAWSSKGTSI